MKKMTMTWICERTNGLRFFIGGYLLLQMIILGKRRGHTASLAPLLMEKGLLVCKFNVGGRAEYILLIEIAITIKIEFQL